METIFTKEEPKKLEEIRKELLAGRPVEVHNEYETFYGVGFDRWLRNGISDINCRIVTRAWNKFGGFYSCYTIYPD